VHELKATPTIAKYRRGIKRRILQDLQPRLPDT
jgi:hypothetical protein